MLCDIYRSNTKSNWFLVVPSGTHLQTLPPYVLSQLGQLSLFKTRDFQPGQPLIGASSDEVLNSIAQYGFHTQGVQVKTTEVSEAGAALGGGMLGGSIAGPVGAAIGAAIGYVLAQNAKEKKDVF